MLFRLLRTGSDILKVTHKWLVYSSHKFSSCFYYCFFFCFVCSWFWLPHSRHLISDVPGPWCEWWGSTLSCLHLPGQSSPSCVKHRGCSECGVRQPPRSRSVSPCWSRSRAELPGLAMYILVASRWQILADQPLVSGISNYQRLLSFSTKIKGLGVKFPEFSV